MENLALRARLTSVVRVGCVVILASGASMACGDAQDANINRSKGGTGGQGATGNTGNTGNSSGTGATNNGGTTGEPEPPCETGERSCAGNVPRECNSKNEWVNEKACGGATKVCTGKGECVPYRLLNAGVDSFGVRPAEGKIVLKEQTLSAAPRVCSKKTGICVTGGVR